MTFFTFRGAKSREWTFCDPIKVERRKSKTLSMLVISLPNGRRANLCGQAVNCGISNRFWIILTDEAGRFQGFQNSGKWNVENGKTSAFFPPATCHLPLLSSLPSLTPTNSHEPDPHELPKRGTSDRQPAYWNGPPLQLDQRLWSGGASERLLSNWYQVDRE